MPNKKIPELDIVVKELADLRYKKGFSRKSMVQYLYDEYEIGWSRAYELISIMMKRTAEMYHKTNQDALSDSVQFLDDLKQSALASGDKKLALEISKELNKVSQLYVQQIELNVKAEVPLFGPEPNKEDKKKK